MCIFILLDTAPIQCHNSQRFQEGSIESISISSTPKIYHLSINYTYLIWFTALSFSFHNFFTNKIRFGANGLIYGALLFWIKMAQQNAQFLWCQFYKMWCQFYQKLCGVRFTWCQFTDLWCRHEYLNLWYPFSTEPFLRCKLNQYELRLSLYFGKRKRRTGKVFCLDYFEIRRNKERIPCNKTKSINTSYLVRRTTSRVYRYTKRRNYW